MKYFVIILCMCSVLAGSVQCKAAYKLKITRAEIVRYNKEYVEARVWITKPDRYTNAMNGEYTIYNIPRDTKVKLKMYEFLSNEYRPFAINLERSLCGFMTLEYNMLYPDFVRLGAHMPEPRCPVKPFFRYCDLWRRANWTSSSANVISIDTLCNVYQGNYSFANYIPNIDNYPAGLPFRNFMLSIQFSNGTVEVSLLKFFGTLDLFAAIREQYG